MSLRTELLAEASYAMLSDCASYESDAPCDGHHAEAAVDSILRWLRHNSVRLAQETIPVGLVASVPTTLDAVCLRLLSTEVS